MMSIAVAMGIDSDKHGANENSMNEMAVAMGMEEEPSFMKNKVEKSINMSSDSFQHKKTQREALAPEVVPPESASIVIIDESFNAPI